MDRRLRCFYIPKKKGSRKIITYSRYGQELKEYHKKVNAVLYKRLLPSKFAKAYIKGRSIISNAKAHMYNNEFLFYDIKDFFPSISHNLLVDKLYYEVNLNRKKIIPKTECLDLVKSCSVSNKGLAQGLVLSPVLSNVYLKDFDNILYGKMKKTGLKRVIYTRYADDLIISAKSMSEEQIQEISKIIKETLSRFHLKLNHQKTRHINIKKEKRVKITGINVVLKKNNYRSLTVGRRKIRDLYIEAISISQNKKGEEYNIAKNRLKGMMAFIISIEGHDFERCLSRGMIEYIRSLGSKSLYDFILKL